MAKIDHAAVRTTAYEDAQKFFEDVFEMHMCILVRCRSDCCMIYLCHILYPPIFEVYVLF